MVKRFDPAAIGKIRYHAAYPVVFDVDDRKVGSSPNTSVVLTVTADADRGIYVTQLMYGYTGSGTPDGTIQIVDGGETVWGPWAVDQKMNVIEFSPPRMGGPEHSLTITLSAGGAGLTGIIWANVLKQA